MQGPPYLYNLTIMLNRAGETRRLTTSSHGQAVKEVLQDLQGRHANFYAWMIMPDHIHLLFGRDDKLDDVDTFAGRVKRRINKAFERRNLHKLNWHDGCTSYDVDLSNLRWAKDHILANPVRGQLVKTAEDWGFSDAPSPLPAGA